MCLWFCDEGEKEEGVVAFLIVVCLFAAGGGGGGGGGDDSSSVVSMIDGQHRAQTFMSLFNLFFSLYVVPSF